MKAIILQFITIHSELKSEREKILQFREALPGLANSAVPNGPAE